MGKQRVDTAAVESLLARARQEVDSGLLPACQVAVALDGELIVDETFGAQPQTRFIPYSATKALTVAAIWRSSRRPPSTSRARLRHTLHPLARTAKVRSPSSR